jgi:hypothetical protein
MKQIYLILVSALISVTVPASEPRQPARNELERLAAIYLVDQFDFIGCEDRGFVYGIGYIDGSYMERILIVKDPPGGTPNLSVEFRGDEMVLIDPLPTQIENGVENISTAVTFMLDLKVTKFNDAVLKNRGSPRFSHSTWFGVIRKINDDWNIDWQGYRRPMLPDSVKDHPEAICTMFEDDSRHEADAKIPTPPSMPDL